MTVQDATNSLFSFFSKNDLFYLVKEVKDPKAKDNFKDVVLVSENPEADRAVVRLGLEEFEKQNLVKKITFAGHDGWILTKPFAAYEQTVSVDPQTALQMSQIINDFCTASKNKTDTCDPLRISGNDIKSLVLIVVYLVDKSAKEEES